MMRIQGGWCHVTGHRNSQFLIISGMLLNQTSQVHYSTEDTFLAILALSL